MEKEKEEGGQDREGGREYREGIEGGGIGRREESKGRGKKDDGICRE